MHTEKCFILSDSTNQLHVNCGPYYLYPRLSIKFNSRDYLVPQAKLRFIMEDQIIARFPIRFSKVYNYITIADHPATHPIDPLSLLFNVRVWGIGIISPAPVCSKAYSASADSPEYPPLRRLSYKVSPGVKTPVNYWIVSIIVLQISLGKNLKMLAG